jgi:predicted phosphoribosyltransferase
MGAIASGGIRVISDDVVRALGIPDRAIATIAAHEEHELERREQVYRAGRPPPDVEGRTVILVDDGLATGSTMRAAVAALKAQNPERLVVAVPVAATETCEALRREVDEVVCALAPEPFFAVGNWYQDFSQISDHEVRALLRRASHALVEVPRAR